MYVKVSKRQKTSLLGGLSGYVSVAQRLKVSPKVFPERLRGSVAEAEEAYQKARDLASPLSLAKETVKGLFKPETYKALGGKVKEATIGKVKKGIQESKEELAWRKETGYWGLFNKNQKEYLEKYPERAKQIEKTMPLLLTPTGLIGKTPAETLVERGDLTEEEARIFKGPEIGMVISGMKFVSTAQANKIITQSIKSQLTRSDLMDITRGMKVDPAKLKAYKTMVGDPAMKKELLAIAKNKKIPLTQKISDYVRNALKTTKPVQPTEVKAITGKELVPKVKPRLLREVHRLKYPKVSAVEKAMRRAEEKGVYVPLKIEPKELSGFKNFIDTSKIKRKDIPYKEMDIAELVKDDKTFPAIRKSGFFATKDIQTAPIKDIYDQTESPYHMALKQDGYKLGGEFGTMFKKVWRPTENAIRTEKEFNVRYVKTIKDLGKKYNIKAKKQNLEYLSDVIENKIKATPNEEIYIKELRGALDDLRNQANVVRRSMGKSEIGYVKDYIPHIQKATLWSEMLANEATISDNLDFIIPNQVKNPFSFERMMKLMPKAERNLYVLLDRYIGVIAKDIYITPAIENIKAYNRVLKNRELIKASKYWDEYIRTGLVGKQHKLDTALSVGYKGRKALQKWNSMVNLAFLTGKLAWNVATQPLSYIMNVPMEAGIRNSIKAIYKSFSKPLRQYVKENSNVLAIKSSDVRAVAIGEGRNIQNRIYMTKIDKYNAFISMIGSVEERTLTLASYVAGLDRAKDLGYKGQDALDFADLTAARTQSMYNKENRALILDSDIARTVFPFQSFSVEMFNHLKEISTKASGAMKLTYRQRTGKLFGLLVGLYTANLYSKVLTGRKKTTVGTFFPFIGNYVDMMVAKAMGKGYYGGRSPITVVQIGSDVIQGARDYINHGSIKKLRKVGVNFGLATLGIGGGGQINNLIDGIMANIDGDVKNIKGDIMFEVDDAMSRVKAPFFGVWATKEGIEYWKPKEEKEKEKPSIEDIWKTNKKTEKSLEEIWSR